MKSVLTFLLTSFSPLPVFKSWVRSSSYLWMGLLRKFSFDFSPLCVFKCVLKSWVKVSSYFWMVCFSLTFGLGLLICHRFNDDLRNNFIVNVNCYNVNICTKLQLYKTPFLPLSQFSERRLSQFSEIRGERAYHSWSNGNTYDEEEVVNCPTRWSLLLLIGYWCLGYFTTQITEKYSTAMC